MNIIRPDRIIVTSNFSIDELFANQKPATISALKRRFYVIFMPLRMY